MAETKSPPLGADEGLTITAPDSAPDMRISDYEVAAIEELLRGSVRQGVEELDFRREIARGGMGTVWLAVDRTLRRPVAVKQIDEAQARDMRQVANFLREARVTAQIDHPNLVPVYHVGVRDRHRVYYTMKLVEGDDLAERVGAKPLEERGRSELLDQIDAIVRICGAVAAAHDFGYAHCDIKPHNIMLGRYGAVYLMDWGLVKPLRHQVFVRSSGHREAVEVCGEESVWIRDAARYGGGTPAYMSPEQAREEPISAATDIFALGAVLYFVLTGQAPFAAASSEASLELAKACELTPPSQLRPDIPPALEAIALRAMAEDPSHRFSSVEAFAVALTRYLRGGGWEFRSVSFAAGAVIIKQGERADAAYVIVEGHCEAVDETGSRSRLLRFMEPGEVFGETAILAGSPRTATVRALTDVKLESISGEVFRREIGSWNPWALRFVQTLARRAAES